MVAYARYRRPSRPGILTLCALLLASVAVSSCAADDTAPPADLARSVAAAPVDPPGGEPVADPVPTETHATPMTPTRAPDAAGQSGPPPVARPSPTGPPEQPRQMEREWLKGAEVAAKYILGDLFAYVLLTGDVATWRSRCLPVSAFCSSVAASVADMHARGRWQDSGSIVFTDAVAEYVVPRGREGRYVVELAWTESGVRLYEADGSELDPEKALVQVQTRATVTLLYLGRGWTVRTVEVHSTSS